MVVRLVHPPERRPEREVLAPPHAELEDHPGDVEDEPVELVHEEDPRQRLPVQKQAELRKELVVRDRCLLEQLAELAAELALTLRRRAGDPELAAHAGKGSPVTGS